VLSLSQIVKLSTTWFPNYYFIVQGFTLRAMKLLDLRNHFGKRGNSSARSVGEEELVEAMQFMSSKNKRIKVYSNYGFVNQSHKFPCRIQFIEGRRMPDDSWDWTIGWESGARKNGIGERIIVT